MKKKRVNAKKETKKLLINSLFTIIAYYCLGIIGLLIMILVPSEFDGRDSKFTIFLFYALLMVSSIVCLGNATLCVQIATVDNEKIIIKDLFHTIAIIKWSEVYSIKKKLLLAGKPVLNYLVISTEKGQEIWKDRLNKKDRFPMIIYATKRNIAIIKEYWKDESF